MIKTADGSKTIQLTDWNEQYHSVHGAIQEASHVFIDSGLRLFSNRKIKILEMGFGTGLNALITLKEAPGQELEIDYVAVEAFPVLSHEIEQLNYTEKLGANSMQESFQQMHASNWEEVIKLTDDFSLQKKRMDFLSVDDIQAYHLVFFDAFGPRVQPELWTPELFEKMFNALKKGGVLVTYSAKGSVRRAMQEVGFTVERLPGPPGKREMLRARKP